MRVGSSTDPGGDGGLSGRTAAAHSIFGAPLEAAVPPTLRVREGKAAEGLDHRWMAVLISFLRFVLCACATLLCVPASPMSSASQPVSSTEAEDLLLEVPKSLNSDEFCPIDALLHLHSGY